jgi:hypothetical protein
MFTDYREDLGFHLIAHIDRGRYAAIRHPLPLLLQSKNRHMSFSTQAVFELLFLLFLIRNEDEYPFRRFLDLPFIPQHRMARILTPLFDHVLVMLVESMSALARCMDRGGVPKIGKIDDYPHGGY